MKKVVSITLIWALMLSMFTGVFPVASALAAPSADGKIAWYLFDQVNGATIKDASGNGMDATLKGNASIVESEGRKALNLDGSSDTYVQLPAGLLKGLTDVTVTSWVYVNSQQGYQRVFDFGNGDSDYMYLLLSGGNNGAKGLAGAITTGGWQQEQTVATEEGTDLEVGVWKHLAFVFSGSTGTETIYLDGEKFAENTEVTVPLSDLGDNVNNFIGKSGLSWDNLTSNIKVADFQVYNKALSSTEILGVLNPNDDSSVKADAASISLGNISAITTDLVLPVSGAKGSTITWESSNKDIIANDGKVTRPTAGQSNATVILTATISKGSVSTTKEFKCTVLAELTEQQKAEADKDAINLGNINTVIKDLVLPASGANGSTITWKSSNENIITSDGKVTRPAMGEANAKVTLTATIINGTAGSTTKDFVITVLAAPSPDGKVAWYKFDNVSGNIAADASGNGNDATLSSASIPVVDGAPLAEAGSKAVNLNGNGQYLELPDGITNTLDEMTVSTWVFQDKGRDYARIFDFGSDSSVNMYLMSYGGGRGLYFCINNKTGEQSIRMNPAYNLPNGVWQHVAVVMAKDPADSSKSVEKMYLNGVKVAEKAGITAKPSDMGYTTSNYIGQSHYADPTFDGSISDFRVYDKPLNDEEILALAGITDKVAAETDRDAIYIGNIFTVESDLVLPTKGKMGSTITWQSSNENLISKDGKVTRPAAGQPDAAVKLTATISKGSESVTREFDCTVLAELTEQKKAELDINAINIGNTAAVTGDLVLPTKGENASTITWESSNLDVLGNDGKVTRPENGMGNAAITLTATATNGSNGKAVRVFNVTVLEKPFVLTLTGFKEVNVTTGVGVKPQMPTVVEALYNDNSTRLLNVVWDEIDSSLYAKPGVFKVEGIVSETTIKPVVNVRVDAFTLNTTFNMDELSPNATLTAKVNAANNGDKNDSVLVIVSLNDPQNTMRNVSYISKEIKPGEVEDLIAGFKLPADVKDYKAKVFVWDGTDIENTNMKPLSSVVELPKTTSDNSNLPAVPSGLSAVPESSSIEIAWDEVSDATGYDIELDGIVVRDVNSPYTHSGLMFNSKHTYSVRAKNSFGASAWSLPIFVTTLKGSGTSSWVTTSFDLGDVQLGGSAFTANRDRTIRYLKSVNDDSMLYTFKVTAGLDTKGAPSLGGWDASDSKLRGHTTGHYLSALAQAYASSGDSELKAKLDYMVTELGKCQDALPSQSNDMNGFNNQGYLAGYPEKQFIRLEAYARYGSGPDDVWAPYYTNHKIMAGLIDAYQLAGNEKALDIVTKMGDWVYGRLSKCTREQLDKMWAIYIAGEYGGMNETMATLYELTGKDEYLKAAKYFDNTRLFDATANNQDILNGMHANQHIPQIVGTLEMFDQTNDPYYYDVTENFWDMVVNHRQYSNGGTGYGEMFKGVDEIAAFIEEGDKQAETCATYNMLKITRGLFFHDPDPKYMDYYERGLYNDILASQDQEREGHNVIYFMPLNPGGQKGFGNGYSCCAGTGMENHTKYQDSIYFKSVDDSTLYVNLYMPSTLNWKEKGITITQDTEWPSQESTTLTVNGNGQLNINLRVPYWATNGFTVKVNGVDQNVNASPSSYVTLSRDWKDGDKIEISYPFGFRIERAPDDASVISIFYGPILMVGKSNETDYIKLTLNTSDLSQSITPVEGQKMNFVTNDVTLVPMYTASGFQYHAYFKINK